MPPARTGLCLESYQQIYDRAHIGPAVREVSGLNQCRQASQPLLSITDQSAALQQCGKSWYPHRGCHRSRPGGAVKVAPRRLPRPARKPRSQVLPVCSCGSSALVRLLRSPQPGAAEAGFACRLPVYWVRDPNERGDVPGAWGHACCCRGSELSLEPKDRWYFADPAGSGLVGQLSRAVRPWAATAAPSRAA